MLIVAKATSYSPRIYDEYSAHKVSMENGGKIRKILNDTFHNLKYDEQWNLYAVQKGELAYTVGSKQSFVVRRGYIFEKKVEPVELGYIDVEDD